MGFSSRTKQIILAAQKAEITEHLIYKRLARTTKDEHNRKVLEKIAEDELRHHDFWKKITEKTVKPGYWQIFYYTLAARLLGLTFGVKLMERGEDIAQDKYEQLKPEIPQVSSIIEDENEHESALLKMLDEEKLKYVGSMVLGLNDALVELTGALAGLTLALQKTKLVAIVGLITGIAAAMSMAAAEYLSTKQDDTEKNPIKASAYTGIAYIFTVLFLIFPYFLFSNIFFCLGLMMANALLVVLVFTFYISVAKDLSFKRRFGEMAGLSLSIAVINFFIGMFIRRFFGVDV